MESGPAEGGEPALAEDRRLDRFGGAGAGDGAASTGLGGAALVWTDESGGGKLGAGDEAGGDDAGGGELGGEDTCGGGELAGRARWVPVGAFRRASLGMGGGRDGPGRGPGGGRGGEERGAGDPAVTGGAGVSDGPAAGARGARSGALTGGEAGSAALTGGEAGSAATPATGAAGPEGSTDGATVARASSRRVSFDIRSVGRACSSVFPGAAVGDDGCRGNGDSGAGSLDAGAATDSWLRLDIRSPR